MVLENINVVNLMNRMNKAALKKCTLPAIALCLAGSALVPAAAQTAAKPLDSVYANGHYIARNEVFAKMPYRKNAVVFLGNSITEAGKWAEILPGVPVQNRGISGDNSFGVLARLPRIVAGKPAKIFLMIGVNDLKREVPVATIIDNYRRMVDLIRKGSPRTHIYLQSVLPVNDSMLIEPFRKVTNADVARLNAALQELARQKRVCYVNLHEVFADERGQLKKDETPDGLHLKIPSYTLWVAYLQRKKYV